MTKPGTRKAIHAYMSDNAHDQWHDFAAEQGVSVSAILEALAPRLNPDTSGDQIGDQIGDIIVNARRIDAASTPPTTQTLKRASPRRGAMGCGRAIG